MSALAVVWGVEDRGSLEMVSRHEGCTAAAGTNKSMLACSETALPDKEVARSSSIPAILDGARPSQSRWPGQCRHLPRRSSFRKASRGWRMPITDPMQLPNSARGGVLKGRIVTQYRRQNKKIALWVELYCLCEALDRLLEFLRRKCRVAALLLLYCFALLKKEDGGRAARGWARN